MADVGYGVVLHPADAEFGAQPRLGLQPVFVEGIYPVILPKRSVKNSQAALSSS